MRSRLSFAALATTIVLVAGCVGAGSPEPSSSAAPAPSSTVAASTAGAPSSPSPTAITARLQSGGDTPLEGAFVSSVTSTPAGFVLIGVARTYGSAPSVVVSGSPDGRTWGRLDSTGLGSSFSAIAVGPLGWVASQQIAASPPSTGTTSVLWFSTDGISWQQLPDQAGLATSSLDAVSQSPISAGPQGFAIVGAGDAGNAVPAVWLSGDGRTWRQASALNGLGIDQVLDLPMGYVAVSSAGAAEFSANGTSWQDLSTDPGSPFGANVGLMLTSVGSTLSVLRYGASGALEIFSGDLGNDAGSSHVTWQHSATADAAFAGANASAAASSNAGALVLGYDRKSLAPIAWTSPDGSTWHRTMLDPATFGGGIPGLIAASGSARTSSFVAIGARTNTAGDMRAQVWRSDDGTAWSAAGGDLLGVLPAAPTGPCPATTPTAVEGFLAMAPSLWPVCFGIHTLRVRGYIADCGGCGGVTNEQASPAWLLDPLGYSAFWLSPAVVPADTGHGGFGVMINPAHPVTVPQVQTHVELTGHFDDPAAATCRVWSNPGGFGLVEPREQTVAACKQAFVVTAIRKLPA